MMEEAVARDSEIAQPVTPPVPIIATSTSSPVNQTVNESTADEASLTEIDINAKNSINVTPQAKVEQVNNTQKSASVQKRQLQTGHNDYNPQQLLSYLGNKTKAQVNAKNGGKLANAAVHGDINERNAAATTAHFLKSLVPTPTVLGDMLAVQKAVSPNKSGKNSRKSIQENVAAHKSMNEAARATYPLSRDLRGGNFCAEKDLLLARRCTFTEGDFQCSTYHLRVDNSERCYAHDTEFQKRKAYHHDIIQSIKQKLHNAQILPSRPTLKTFDASKGPIIGQSEKDEMLREQWTHEQVYLRQRLLEEAETLRLSTEDAEDKEGDPEEAEEATKRRNEVQEWVERAWKALQSPQAHHSQTDNGDDLDVSREHLTTLLHTSSRDPGDLDLLLAQLYWQFHLLDQDRDDFLTATDIRTLVQTVDMDWMNQVRAANPSAKQHDPVLDVCAQWIATSQAPSPRQLKDRLAGKKMKTASATSMSFAHYVYALAHHATQLALQAQAQKEAAEKDEEVDEEASAMQAAFAQELLRTPFWDLRQVILSRPHNHFLARTTTKSSNAATDGSGSGRSPWQPEGYLLKRGYFFANERWNAYRLRYFKLEKNELAFYRVPNPTVKSQTPPARSDKSTSDKSSNQKNDLQKNDHQKTDQSVDDRGMDKAMSIDVSITVPSSADKVDGDGEEEVVVGGQRSEGFSSGLLRVEDDDEGKGEGEAEKEGEKEEEQEGEDEEVAQDGWSEHGGDNEDVAETPSSNTSSTPTARVTNPVGQDRVYRGSIPLREIAAVDVSPKTLLDAKSVFLLMQARAHQDEEARRRRDSLRTRRVEEDDEAAHLRTTEFGAAVAAARAQETTTTSAAEPSEEHRDSSLATKSPPATTSPTASPTASSTASGYVFKVTLFNGRRFTLATVSSLPDVLSWLRFFFWWRESATLSVAFRDTWGSGRSKRVTLRDWVNAGAVVAKKGLIIEEREKRRLKKALHNPMFAAKEAAKMASNVHARMKKQPEEEKKKKEEEKDEAKVAGDEEEGGEEKVEKDDEKVEHDAEEVEQEDSGVDAEKKEENEGEVDKGEKKEEEEKEPEKEKKKSAVVKLKEQVVEAVQDEVRDEVQDFLLDQAKEAGVPKNISKAALKALGKHFGADNDDEDDGGDKEGDEGDKKSKKEKEGEEVSPRGRRSLAQQRKKKTEDDEEDEEGDLTEQERFYLQVVGLSEDRLEEAKGLVLLAVKSWYVSRHTLAQLDQQYTMGIGDKVVQTLYYTFNVFQYAAVVQNRLDAHKYGVRWDSSSNTRSCAVCFHVFKTFALRRTLTKHHCRVCGRVVCHLCSLNKVPIAAVGGREERCCTECFQRGGPPEDRIWFGDDNDEEEDDGAEDSEED